MRHRASSQYPLYPYYEDEVAQVHNVLHVYRTAALAQEETCVSSMSLCPE